MTIPPRKTETMELKKDIHALAASAPGYEPLAAVLSEAFHQAAFGKGKERHADAKPFIEQPMQDLIRLYGPGFALGQAAKKAQESQRLPYERARAELLGAIVYTAGAIIAMDRQNGTKPANDNFGLNRLLRREEND